MDSEHKMMTIIAVTIFVFAGFWVWYANKTAVEQYQHMVAAGLQECSYTVLSGSGFSVQTTWRKECPNALVTPLDATVNHQ